MNGFFSERIAFTFGFTYGFTSKLKVIGLSDKKSYRPLRVNLPISYQVIVKQETAVKLAFS